MDPTATTGSGELTSKTTQSVFCAARRQNSGHVSTLCAREGVRSITPYCAGALPSFAEIPPVFGAAIEPTLADWLSANQSNWERCRSVAAMELRRKWQEMRSLFTQLTNLPGLAGEFRSILIVVISLMGAIIVTVEWSAVSVFVGAWKNTFPMNHQIFVVYKREKTFSKHMS